jgi:hypothetical protein
MSLSFPFHHGVRIVEDVIRAAPPEPPDPPSYTYGEVVVRCEFPEGDGLALWMFLQVDGDEVDLSAFTSTLETGTDDGLYYQQIRIDLEGAFAAELFTSSVNLLIYADAYPPLMPPSDSDSLTVTHLGETYSRTISVTETTGAGLNLLETIRISGDDPVPEPLP